jgi:hypothetical protein
MESDEMYAEPTSWLADFADREERMNLYIKTKCYVMLRYVMFCIYKTVSSNCVNKLIKFCAA